MVAVLATTTGGLVVTLLACWVLWQAAKALFARDGHATVSGFTFTLIAAALVVGILLTLCSLIPSPN